MEHLQDATVPIKVAFYMIALS